MSAPHKLLRALRIESTDAGALRRFSARSGVPVERLRHLDHAGTFPTGNDLEAILGASGLDELQLKLLLCCFDNDVAEAIRTRAADVAGVITSALAKSAMRNSKAPKVALTTSLGKLYRGDCLDVLAGIKSDTVDVVFADPPFNLNKLYRSRIDDDLRRERYIAWCEEWINECARVLKPGGSFFFWNLPKWNAALAAVAGRRLTFRHWIAVDIKYTLPIAGRLYPSHYGLLYYIKGEKPNTFQPDRLEVCPSCAHDLRDYGGYKDKMNPKGVNLSDVWYDIPPVRHAKYKRRKEANELSIKLLDRVLQFSSKEGDLIFDPFGGSGTTYVVAEMKARRWIGVEIGPVDDIVGRFKRIDEEAEFLARIRSELNVMFTSSTMKERLRRGLWTVESERARKSTGASQQTRELDFG